MKILSNLNILSKDILYTFVTYRVAVIEVQGQLQYFDSLRFISVDVSIVS